MKKHQITILAALLVFAAILRLWDFNQPWTNDFRGWGGSFYGNIARNYLEFGCAQTKAAPVRSVNPQDSAHFQYYLDHPPMTGWLLSLSFLVFGCHEWSARLVPVLCSMGGLILLYLIIRRFWKTQTVLIALAIAAVAPMAAFYGSFVDVQGPIPFFFVLLALYLYLRFDKRTTWGRWIAVLIAFIVSALSDWPAYYLVPVILVHHFFSKSAGLRRWRVLLLPAVALAAIALFVFYINWVEFGSASFRIDEMVQWFVHRAISTASEASGQSFTVVDWFGAIAQNLRVMFSLPVLILAAVGLLFYVLRIASRRADKSDGVLALLLAFGLMHVLIFRQGAYDHDFWGYYLYPAIALLAAICVVRSGEVLFANAFTLRAIFYFAITLAACAASTASDLNLQRTRGSADYAAFGKTLNDLVPRQTLFLAEEKLPDYWNYRFAFYLADYTEYARPCAPNLQVAALHHGGAVFLINVENPGDRVMSNFKATLLEHAARSIRVGPVCALDVTGLWSALGTASVPPPRDIKTDYTNGLLKIYWKHDQPEKVTRFKIYRKSDRQTFYTDITDIFAFTATNEASSSYDLRAPMTLIVTAVDAEDRETGFAEEIRVTP